MALKNKFKMHGPVRGPVIPEFLQSKVERISCFSRNERIAFRNNMARRAEVLIGGRQGAELCALFKTEGAEAVAAYDKAFEEYHELCARADEGDGEAQQELQEIRVWSIQNMIYAGANYATFFEMDNLEGDDVPYIETTTPMPEGYDYVTYVGQDGGQPMWQAIKYWQKNPVTPFWLTSNEFEYPLIDEYSGEVADRSKACVDIAYDENMKLDFILFTYLQDLIGEFNLDGVPQSNVYVPHHRINPANLPSTNLLIPADAGTDTDTGLFRKSCMDCILKYAKQWGDNAFKDGPLRPVSVFIPSLDITGFLEEVRVSDPVNDYNVQIFEFGFVMNYAGQRWAFIADSTLDPNEGVAYVKFNKPVGKLWTKTSLDQLIVDDTPAKKKQNLESQVSRKVFFCGIPAVRRINIAAVQYKQVEGVKAPGRKVLPVRGAAARKIAAAAKAPGRTGR